MTQSSEDREALLGLLSRLSPGELSTLVASSAEPGSQIGTSTDSENFAFLRRMADLGLAEEVPLQIDLPPEIRDLLTSFSLTKAGRKELETLLQAASLGPWREG
jgi:hypothetical protein